MAACPSCGFEYEGSFKFCPAAHALRSGRRSGLVFGRTADQPFEPTTLSGRAGTAWKRMNLKRKEAELDPIAPISLHEGRHTFASLMIAAGVNAKALSTYMGHASITITLDRYGHLMPGNEQAAAGLLDAFLRTEGGGRESATGTRRRTS